MRSLKRNAWPQDADGKQKRPSNYREFLRDLTDNFGLYCCYCEHTERALDIDHVVPKSADPSLECNWNNLLLACPACNRHKGNKNQDRSGYIWPDTCDSFWFYEYQPDGSMSVNPAASLGDQNAAENIIEMLDLNSNKDNLCNLRREQWNIASDDLADYEKGVLSVDRIVKNVAANGHWSVWMTVFKDYPEVTQKIADAFPGTLSKYCTP